MFESRGRIKVCIFQVQCGNGKCNYCAENFTLRRLLFDKKNIERKEKKKGGRERGREGGKGRGNDGKERKGKKKKGKDSVFKTFPVGNKK